MFFILFLSFLSGFLFLLLLQITLLAVWFLTQPRDRSNYSPNPPPHPPPNLDPSYVDSLLSGILKSPSSESFVNALSVFLFQELKDSAHVRAALLLRLNNEIAAELSSLQVAS